MVLIIIPRLYASILNEKGTSPLWSKDFGEAINSNVYEYVIQCRSACSEMKEVHISI